MHRRLHQCENGVTTTCATACSLKGTRYEGTNESCEEAAPRQSRLQPNATVDAVFDACPSAVRTKLEALRRLIFDTANATKGVGAHRGSA
jgi:hypothetical protein